MDIRPAREADLEAVRRVARESLVASYSTFLDDDIIDDAVEQWYGDDASDELLDSHPPLLVAVDDDTVLGFTQSALVEADPNVSDATTTVGEIRWLHVDPDARDRGVGDTLLDRTSEELTDAGATHILGYVLEGNKEGNRFYEDNGFVPLDTRTIEIGGNDHTENVYVRALEDDASVEWYTTETIDGETFQIALDETERGSKSPFYAAYRDRDDDTHYAWYCSNCRTIDVAVDSMGRIVCNRCDNSHQATRWDAAYL